MERGWRSQRRVGAGRGPASGKDAAKVVSDYDHGLHTQTQVEEPFMQHNAGQKPSSSFLPNGQMHGEDRVEDTTRLTVAQRKERPCPAQHPFINP